MLILERLLERQEAAGSSSGEEMLVAAIFGGLFYYEGPGAGKSHSGALPLDYEHCGMICPPGPYNQLQWDPTPPKRKLAPAPASTGPTANTVIGTCPAHQWAGNRHEMP